MSYLGIGLAIFIGMSLLYLNPSPQMHRPANQLLILQTTDKVMPLGPKVIKNALLNSWIFTSEEMSHVAFHKNWVYITG